MQENFLHFLWQFRRFHQDNLHTTEGETIRIKHIGTHNTDAGPDFFNAQIQIGTTLWAGNVEMHLMASDWKKHQHQHDRAYDNVILHVVLEEDEVIFRSNGQRIPCLELRRLIPQKLQAIYQKIWHNKHWIPCQHHFYQVSELLRLNWLDRILVERLQAKTQLIENALKDSHFDWESVFYRFLARNFGLKVNSDAFEQLALSLPLALLRKYKNQLSQLEALLFGQAGLLKGNFSDSYPLKLQKEYIFLQKKHQLQSIDSSNWKFMRMRPANFPSIRIAQFARLLYQTEHLFSKVLVVKSVQEIENMFTPQLSDYWLTHYRFDKTSVKQKKNLGKGMIHLIIINTIVPFLFAYATNKDDTDTKAHAIALLEALPPEKNNILKQWAALGQIAQNAAQSQALLHLKKQYCTAQKCLQCAIGNQILKC